MSRVRLADILMVLLLAHPLLLIPEDRDRIQLLRPIGGFRTAFAVVGK